jgi:hypothetical protein
MDKENQPEMPERKHAGDPGAVFGATHLVGSYPSNRNLAVGHFFLASALQLVNRHEDARTAAKAGLLLDPSFTVARFRASAATDNPTYLARRERVYDGMLRAGLPE